MPRTGKCLMLFTDKPMVGFVQRFALVLEFEELGLATLKLNKDLAL